MTHKLSDANVEWLRSAWANGVTQDKMKRRLGVHWDALARIARELGLPPRKNNNAPWNPEHTDRLEVLFRKGHSFTQIAGLLTKETGVSYTRNAVLGKAHRMGWSGREPAAAPVVKAAKPLTPKPAKIRQPRGVGAFILPPTYGGNGFALATANAVLNAAARSTRVDEPDKPTGIKLEALTVRMCRWPVGDVQDDDFSFCGCARQDQRPYCEAHNERAYTAPQPRKVKPYDPAEHRPRRAA